MKAAFLHKPGDLRIGVMEKPLCGDQDLLIRVLFTGLCGSDLHYYKDGRVGNNVVKDPHVLGHESVGEVVETGAGVKGFKKGDRVVMEPGVPCMECDLCKKGKYHLCMTLEFLGVPGHPGTFREYVAHNYKFCFKLPESITTEDGAMIEPLAVALHTVNQAGIHPGDKVLITGAGPIGTLCVLMAKISGASFVSITDVDDFRLDIAAQMGADETLNVFRRRPEEDSYDCAIEASGVESAYKTIMDSVKKSANIALVGMTNREIPFSITQILKKELEMKGVYRYVNDYPSVIRLLASGRLDMSALITKKYPLSQLNVAMADALDSNINKMKILIENTE